MDRREGRGSLRDKHVRLVLERLYRQTTETAHETIAFQTLCTAVGTPESLRPAVLQALLGRGYVLYTDDDQLLLAERGRREAVAVTAKRPWPL